MLELTFPLSSVPVRPQDTLKAEFLKRAGCDGAAFTQEESRPKGVRSPRLGSKTSRSDTDERQQKNQRMCEARPPGR